MSKFLAVAATALTAFAGTAHATAEAAPCVPLSFVDQSASMASLNGVIDIALSSGLLKPNLTPFDPLAMTNKRLDVVPFSVLGMDFTLTPTIQTLNAVGISNVVPRHLNVTGPSGLDIGADFPGALGLDATVSFELAQLNHKWWQICWTNILKPASCPPTTITVDVGVGLQDFSLFSNADVAMVMCSPTAQAGTCKDLTVSDILVSALNKDYTTLLTRILNRVASASFSTIELAFNKITYLNFHFQTSGPLLTELGKKLLNFTTTELNKKGDMYKAIISTVNKLAKTLLNQVIQEKLGPLFKNTCYDA